jgi:hypothetical protein
VELTPIAAVVIPLSVYGFFFAPDFLYRCMVFSLPFVATAVVNIGSKGSASGLQAAILFGTLWLVRSGPKTLGTPGLWESQHIRTSIRHLRFFMLVVAASLVMPIWIHGGLTVDCADPM